LQKAGHKFNTPSPELLAKIKSVNDKMLAEWAADGANFGVAKPMEMVEFYHKRYDELNAK
jgi:hypothetical protein